MYERQALPRPAVAAFLLVVGCGLLLTSSMLPAANITAERFWHWGLPAFLIVTSALALESKLKQWRLPMLLGDASYSIYLTHGVVLSAVKSAVVFSGKGAQPLMSGGFIFVGCVASIVAGVAVYQLIERPLSGVFTKLTAIKQPTAAFGTSRAT
jgi:exopolysaccharide production protein ExoZ